MDESTDPAAQQGLDWVLKCLEKGGPAYGDAALGYAAVRRALHFASRGMQVGASEVEAAQSPDPLLPVGLWRALNWLEGMDPDCIDEVRQALHALARRSGSAAACRYWGLVLRKEGAWESSLAWFARAAEAGHPLAWFECGWVEVLRSGRKDPSEFALLPSPALVYFQQGADAGDAQSAFLLYRHWAEVASRENDLDAAEIARLRVEHYLQIAALGGSEYALLPWAHDLAARGQWQEAFETALAAAQLDFKKLPASLKKTFYPARWAAARLLARAPRDAIADWPGAIANVEGFLEDMTQPDARSNFASLVDSVRGRQVEAAGTPAQLALSLHLQACPPDVHGVPVQALFGNDRSAARLQQRNAFERVRQLLRDKKLQQAKEALDAVFQSALEMEAAGWSKAWEVRNDAGLHWLHGQILMAMGQDGAALDAFRHSAELKDDPDHVALCYERIAALHASGGNYGAAATAALEGFRVGGNLHAGMLVRFAELKLRHHPAANGIEVLKLLKYMVGRQRALWNGDAVEPWRYLGNDPAWRSVGDIAVPRDEQPGHTLTRMVALFRDWAEAVRDDPGALGRVTNTRDWLADLLIDEVLSPGRHQDLPAEQVYALARLAESERVQDVLSRLIIATADLDAVHYQWRNRAAVQSRHLATLLQAIAAGCSSAGHIPDALVSAAAQLACARPALWDEDFRAAQAAVSLLWRALLERYADGPGTEERHPVAQFGDWIRELVVQPLASIGDDDQRRRWFFELLVGNPAAAEYAMSARVARHGRRVLRPLLDLRATRDVHRWLRYEGGEAMHAFVDLLLLRTDDWLPKAHAALDTDTGRYACRLFEAHLHGRLNKEYEHSGKRLDVQSRWHGEPPPVSAIEASMALTELVNLAATQPALTALDLWEPLRACAIRVDMDEDREYPVHAEVHLRFAPLVDRGFVSWACGRLLEEAQSRNALVDVAPTGPKELRLSWTLPIRPRWSSVPSDWLRFFNEFKSEYDEFRSTGITISGFYDLMQRRFPGDFPRSTPARYVEDWTLVIHLACDRLWALFLTRVLSGREDERSALTTLHGLKTEVDDLRHRSATYAPDFRRQLDLVRNRLLRLEDWTKRVLAEELHGHEVSLFDLVSVVSTLAERAVPGLAIPVLIQPHDAPTQVLGPRAVVERVLGELLYNAARHGVNTCVTAHRITRLEWSIEIETTRRRLRPSLRQQLHSTGIGLNHAKALCTESALRMTVLHDEGSWRARLDHGGA
jgi:hypothetical protein